MKKIVMILLVAAMLVPCVGGFAQEATTVLPYAVTFQMDYNTVLGLLGDKAQEDQWEEETGTLMLSDCAAGVGELQADDVSFQIDRNNSEKVSRLSQIDMMLPVGENSISSFRKVLAAVTAVYGAPDSDPFDEASVANYVEYGGLSATWTKADARISLSLSRMYQESINLDFASRLCYNADDLK